MVEVLKGIRLLPGVSFYGEPKRRSWLLRGIVCMDSLIDRLHHNYVLCMSFPMMHLILIMCLPGYAEG